MTRIPVNPERLTWARERAGLEALVLAAWQSMCRCGNTECGIP